MIEKRLDLWAEAADAKCITTNGFIKNNGKLVMGAGVAGQAQVRYPVFPKLAGLNVQLHGNHVFPYRVGELRTESWLTDEDNTDIYITFPVKHKFFEEADLQLIERSAHELMTVVDRMTLGKVLLPRPGCGNGKLKWDDVKPVIENILDDRIWVITY